MRAGAARGTGTDRAGTLWDGVWCTGTIVTYSLFKTFGFLRPEGYNDDAYFAQMLGDLVSAPEEDVAQRRVRFKLVALEGWKM